MADPVIGPVGATIETRAEATSGPGGEVKFWLQQLELSEREDRNFVKRGRKIVERYRDERSRNLTDRGVKRYNILWSNVQTLLPALYNRTPKPEVDRRFKDSSPTARLGAMVLERALSYALDNCDFDGVMEDAVEDRLLPGRGIVRLRYIPHYGEEVTPKLYLKAATVGASSVDSGSSDEQEEPTYTTEDGQAVDKDQVKFDGQNQPYMDGEPYKPVTYEEVMPEYKFWEDVRFSPARKFKQTTWVAFREYLTRDELVARFKDKGKQVNLDYTPKGVNEADQAGPANDAFKKAVVWEIWDKSARKVKWLATGYEQGLLDDVDDPLKLINFFPMPSPLTATTTNDQQTPVADYVEYQDQAKELDVLTTRIDKLTRALKVAGAYAGEERATLQQLVDEGSENKLIPVDHWAAFAGDKGGLQGLIVWLPIDQVAKVLIGLVDQRERVKQSIYELTGMADLIRGSTNPDETYGAQRLKSHYYTLRMSRPQRRIALFARDVIRIMGEIIASQFSPQTLSLITGFPEPVDMPQLPAAPPAAVPGQNGIPQPNPAFQQYQAQMAQAQQAVVAETAKRQQEFLAAVEFLRQSAPHPFRIDIEADSTIAPDEDAEKQARTEFLGALIPLLEQIVPMIRQYPPLAKFGKQIVMFGVRGFRAGRSLEESLEEAFDALSQMPAEPPQTGKGKSAGQDPSVEMAKLGIQQQQAQGDLAIKAAKAEADKQFKMAKIGLEARGQAMDEEYQQAEILSMERKILTGTP